MTQGQKGAVSRPGLRVLCSQFQPDNHIFELNFCIFRLLRIIMRLLHGTCWKDANTNYYDVINHCVDDRDDG